jgi:hypothetical protein
MYLCETEHVRSSRNASWLIIRMFSIRILGPLCWNSWLRFPLIFLGPSNRNSEMVSWFGHYRFLPDTFQFITHQSCTIWCYSRISRSQKQQIILLQLVACISHVVSGCTVQSSAGPQTRGWLFSVLLVQARRHWVVPCDYTDTDCFKYRWGNWQCV